MMTPYMLTRQKMKQGNAPTAQQKKAEEKKSLPKQAPIAKQSPKRKEEDKEYNKARKDYLAKNVGCEAHVATGCTGLSCEIHHKSRRSSKDDRINPENFLAVCRPCHLWLGAHPKQAMELGLSETAIKPKKKK